MTELVVQLGLEITNYSYDNVTECLHISGPAIEEGNWIGANGVPLYFSKEVIHESIPLFNSVPLVCEHRGLEIGQVLQVEKTELGFSIKDAIVTHKPSIDAILAKEKLGFSIEGHILYDDIRLMVKKITKADNISLVTNPACKVCGITNIYTDKGKVVMSKKIKDDVEVSESVEADAEPIIETDVVEDSNTEEPKVDEVSTPTSVPTVNISTNSIVIEQPLEEIMAALSTATSTVDAVSAQLSSAITRLQEMESKLTDADTKLSAKDSELETAKAEAIDYKTKFETLQLQLNARDLDERNKLVSEIKYIDPEITEDFINSLSTVQLSAHKSSLERLSTKGMIGGERLGFKVDEAVPGLETPVALSEPTDPKDFTGAEVAKLICESLRKQSLSSRVC